MIARLFLWSNPMPLARAVFFIRVAVESIILNYFNVLIGVYHEFRVSKLVFCIWQGIVCFPRGRAING